MYMHPGLQYLLLCNENNSNVRIKIMRNEMVGLFPNGHIHYPFPAETKSC